MSKSKLKNQHSDAAFDALMADFDADEVTAMSENDIQVTEKLVAHGIRMRDADKQEFKEWCVRHKMTAGEAFVQAFKLLKKQHGR